MEDILQAFPTMVKIPETYLRSVIYQPDRISLNSNDSLTTIVDDGNLSYFGNVYDKFRIQLNKPALGVKSVQLIRASIPQPLPNIPDYQTMFFYYRIPAVDGEIDFNNGFDAANIRMIRLLPQMTDPPESFPPNNYGFNRSFTGYDDLISELNKACASDPIEDEAGYLSYYVPNDIQFVYDTKFNKIKMAPTAYLGPTPSAPNFYYMPCGFDDPNLAIFINNILAFLNQYSYPLAIHQPTLNMRLGWSWSGLYGNIPRLQQEQALRIVPQGMYSDGEWVDIQPYSWANTYANLVYTACVSIYVDWIGGSSQDSGGNGGLLAVVPVGQGNNSVSYFNNVLHSPLFKIPPQIQEIEIQMRDEVGQPFSLPNSAIVNIELGFSYT